MPENIGAMSAEQIKIYAQNTAKISSAVVSLLNHDGWKIFKLLYERQKQDIKDKDDYASLQDFKADRAAIEIVESILTTFEGYISDAESAAKLLAGVSEEPTRDRGIMLVDQMEGGSIEG